MRRLLKSFFHLPGQPFHDPPKQFRLLHALRSIGQRHSFGVCVFGTESETRQDIPRAVLLIDFINDSNVAGKVLYSVDCEIDTAPLRQRSYAGPAPAGLAPVS